MSSTTPSMRDRAANKWAELKPLVTGLAIGVIAGPIISGFAGFQVRTSTAEAATRAGVVEQQAAFCVERARAVHTATGPIDWQKRNELARTWAVMPGTTTADQEVVFACSSRLGQ